MGVAFEDLRTRARTGVTRGRCVKGEGWGEAMGMARRSAVTPAVRVAVSFEMVVLDGLSSVVSILSSSVSSSRRGPMISKTSSNMSMSVRASAYSPRLVKAWER